MSETVVSRPGLKTLVSWTADHSISNTPPLLQQRMANSAKHQLRLIWLVHAMYKIVYAIEIVHSDRKIQQQYECSDFDCNCG